MTSRAAVIELDALRIDRVLARRTRYRYVRPRVVREGGGWKIVSPNCSRTIDARGAEIDIAWLEPDGAGRWLVHARDHRAGAWTPKVGTASLAAALAIVCADPDREYWP
ncbi:MAG TPA: hypothetical protein VFZ93_13010 [Albitalea sp.]